jgi:peroxiredoxin
MQKILTSVFVILVLFFQLNSARAEGLVSGEAAPRFTLSNALGQQVSFEALKGKVVVLEWFNPGCPFVKKFYSKGDMQNFQRQAREQGATWLTINSSAPGRQGYIAPTDAVSIAKDHGIDPAQLLLDPSGEVGRLFGAKTTPHIFVVNAKGILVYSGAIDSTASTEQSDIASSVNYALNAINAVNRGEVPIPASTESYGCSVKY